MESTDISLAVELTKSIGGIISDLKWPLVSALFLYLSRDGISAFVKRLVNFDFKWGEAQGSLKAGPSPEDSRHFLTPVQAEKPPESIGETERMESKSIEEEQKADWFLEMYKAFMEGRANEGKEAFERHQATVTEANERTRVRAIYLHLDYTRNGSHDSLLQLQQLFSEISAPSLKEEVAFWLALSYSRTRDFDSELALWRGMLDSATDEEKRATFASNVATTLVAMQQRSTAKELLITYLLNPGDPKTLRPVYKALGDLESKEGDPLLAAIAYEKVAQLSPHDPDVLFTAAYAQSHCELNYASYINYDTILSLRSDAALASNNMGVQALSIGMAGRSVMHYQKAAELGNTLAMANIAYLYLNGGFLKEAEDIIRQAMKQKEPHPNVTSALAELEKRKKSEADAQEKAVTKGAQQREFIRAYADARFTRAFNREEVAGIWVSERGGNVTFEASGAKLSGSWEETGGNILSGGKDVCKLEATIVNASLHGSFARQPQESTSCISRLPTIRNFIGLISNDGTELKMMFRDKESHIFYAFTRSKEK